MKENFAQRYGYSKVKEIQFENMDNELRIRLLNFVKHYLDNLSRDENLRYLAREYFIIESSKSLYIYDDVIRKELLEGPWYSVYNFLECVIPLIIHNCEVYYNTDDIIGILNRILNVEKAAYRFIGDMIVPITNQEELNSINDVISTKYDSVNKHMSKALNFYSDRANPDYENSIKESISGVEALCCIIVGNDHAVLSSALDRLNANGVRIHRAQAEAFKKLYGYTSDENGIRHAGIDFINASEEDAKYMLISCSSFINYLIQKYEKIAN